MTRYALLPLLLLLTACTAGGGVFVSERRTSAAGSSSFSYIAGGRDLETAVFGNPFGGTDAAFGRHVATTFNERNSREPTNFTTTPGPSARPSYRLVVLFNPQTTVVAVQLCRAPETVALAPTARPLVLQLALCDGDFSLASLRGRLADATGPDDPRFEEFLEQALSLLLQPSLRRRFL